MSRVKILTGCLVAALVLAACNTVAGFGQDLSHLAHAASR